jgi:hypothetical protein
MDGAREVKVVRSYTLVFRRRWRIFRVQSWRIPLPGGLELRLLGYWLGCLVAVAVMGRVPVMGSLVELVPASARFVVCPLLAAWALSRWEVDGRAPHRALVGGLFWLLRPRVVASFRRVPRVGAVEVPVGEVVVGPDLSAASYPRGVIEGPARLLLRYPVNAFRGRDGFSGVGATRSLRLRGASTVPLARGRTLDVPSGHKVRFE